MIEDHQHVVYMKTSDPGRLVRIWRSSSGPELEIIEGEVDETSAVPSCLTQTHHFMKRVQEELKAHDLQLREPRRMFLRRWR